MAQAKRKTAGRTAKKTTARKTTTRKKSCVRSSKSSGISDKERMHLYVVTSMAIVTGILLCANAAMLVV